MPIDSCVAELGGQAIVHHRLIAAYRVGDHAYDDASQHLGQSGPMPGWLRRGASWETSGVENDPDLLAFNEWRARQPDLDESSLVYEANDHSSKAYAVWWAGPETSFLQRMRDEARARGITLTVNSAKYSTNDLDEAVERIFDHQDLVRQVGFDLQGIAGPTSEFFGLIVEGTQPDHPEQQLSPALIASVRRALGNLLEGCGVQMDDVRVEYGRVTPA